jgi:uncharacterized protein (TIGR02680 family)
MDSAENTTRSAAAPLPEAESLRWQPLRSGLVNFYRYDDQEFHFHRGRLLLRGNNGTGKSRVLALQLPFLLDGETSSHRVEPDADPAKRFDWNLLMGRYDDRLGYTWIEFGRRDEDGLDHYLTLGCGVRAASGRGIAGKWFFVTSQRIGRDLMLCSSLGNPLPKDSLLEALAGSGRLFTTASEYRVEVNRRLFELHQDRYEALIDLLIELRKPQLARQLDEGRLSNALSNALPPVSQRIISQVAEAMRALEEDRVMLENLVAAKRSADAFLREYRQYAAILACRRSEEVRKAQSAYENRQRRLREAESHSEQAEQQRRSLLLQQEELSLEQARALGEKQILENSPEMRSARDLDAATTRATERRREAERASSEHEESTRERESSRRALERCMGRAEAALADLRRRLDVARLAATACGMSREHNDGLPEGVLEHSDDPKPREEVQRSLGEAIQTRRRSVRLLGQLNAEVAAARQAFRAESDKRDQEQERVTEAAEALSAADQEVVVSVGTLAEAYRQWCAAVVVLSPATPPEVVPDIALWCEAAIDVASPVRAAVDQAMGKLQRVVASRRAAREQERGAVEEKLRALQDERERLLKGEHQPPPPPYTRDPESRRTSDGAPFWMLCEFLDEVPIEQRAAVEAAMESSGLLDAWVNPEGTIQNSETRLDTFLLDAAQQAELPSYPTLAELLRPSADRTGGPGRVPTEVIERIIRSVGLGENSGSVWVDVQGRWQIGPKAGRWTKPAAQHIGQAAREAARLRRLGELHDELLVRQKALEEIHAALGEIDEQEATARAEVRLAPDDSGVRSAVAKRDAQQQQLMQRAIRFEEAELRVSKARERLGQETAERDATAADLGLGPWIDDLQSLEDALQEYQQSLGALWLAAREHLFANLAVREEGSRSEGHRLREDRLLAARREAEQKAAAGEAQLAALRQTVGAAVEEVQQRLRDLEQRLEYTQLEQRKTDKTLGATEERVQFLAESIVDLKQEMEADIFTRARAIEHLTRFARTGLLHVAITREPWLDRQYEEELSVTAAVELARRIGVTLDGVEYSDDVWDKNQKLIHYHVQELTNALGSHDYRPEYTTDNDVLVVTVPFQGERRQMNDFGSLLAEEIINRSALLTAKEREILENYLIHDVAVELGSLIRRGAELVRDMSKQLQLRPTSTGMMLQFKWEALPEGPAALHEARKKLMGESSTWSPADRMLLGDFLEEQIRRVREAETTATWQEQLTIALDYRRWHQFHIERKQDGDWHRLTKRTHGTGSGGEKALALTIPQFAAAAAYYGSAGKFAPRLILLDEAFVGIDADMRSKCMGMLHEFDLDFVMTSEREWGCYATLPGLAIYQLSARAGVDAVWASRWVWNGRERVEHVDGRRRGAAGQGLETAESHAAESAPNGNAKLSL